MPACLVFISFAYMIRHSFTMDLLRMYFTIPALTCIFIQTTLFVSTIHPTIKFAIMTIWLSRNIRLLTNYARILHLILCRNMCFGNLLELPQWGDSNKYQNMFCAEIRKQDFSYILMFPLSILYNSKFTLMAKSLGTNAVVVTRVRCSLQLR